MIISQYINYKFSNWLSRDLEISRIRFNFPNKILIEDISIKNDNFYKYENTFEADKIYIDLNLESYFFDNLKIINKIIFVNPILYLEIIEKKDVDNSDNVYYTDNLGIANKISQNIPDKVWPKKKVEGGQLCRVLRDDMPPQAKKRRINAPNKKAEEELIQRGLDQIELAEKNMRGLVDIGKRCQKWTINQSNRMRALCTLAVRV